MTGGTPQKPRLIQANPLTGAFLQHGLKCLPIWGLALPSCTLALHFARPLNDCLAFSGTSYLPGMQSDLFGIWCFKVENKQTSVVS